MKERYKDFSLFLFLIIFLNFLGPLAVFLPLPFFVFKDRLPIKTIFLSSFIPVIVLWYLLPDDLSFFLSFLNYGSLVLPSLLIVYFHRVKRVTLSDKVFFTSLSIIIFIVITGFLSSSILGKDIFSFVFDEFFKTGNIGSDDLEYLKRIFHFAGYGLMFFSEAVFFLFNAIFFSKDRSVFNDFKRYKAQTPVVVFTVFFIFAINILWVIGLLHGIILKITVTIAFFLVFLFFVQGLSIYLFFLNKIEVSGFAKMLSIVLIFIYPLPIILSIVGILDYWIDFRFRIKKIGGGKIV